MRYSLAAIMLVLSLSAVTVAQPAPTNTPPVPAVPAAVDASLLKAASDHQQAGEQFFAAQKWSEARIEFEAAYQLTLHPDLLFNLGVVCERSGDNQNAIQYFERFLRASPSPDPATETRLQRLRLLSGPASQQAPPTAPAVAQKRFPTRRIVALSVGAFAVGALVSAAALGWSSADDRDRLLSGQLTYSQAVDQEAAAVAKRSASIGLGAAGGLCAGLSVLLFSLPVGR